MAEKLHFQLTLKDHIEKAGHLEIFEEKGFTTEAELLEHLGFGDKSYMYSVMDPEAEGFGICKKCADIGLLYGQYNRCKPCEEQTVYYR